MISLLPLAYPLIAFAPGGGPRLIGINNPEQILQSDLADNSMGKATLYKDRLAQGAYRDWFEHINNSGGRIGYAVILTNPGLNSAVVRVHGKALATGLLGGKPFSDLLNTYSLTGTLTTIPARSSVALWRNDSAVSSATFFSGVIDFDIVRGSVTLENVAYRTYSSIASTRQDIGYVQRIETDGTHEARVYKGWVGYSNVQASGVNLTASDADPVGPMSLYSSTYNLTSRSYNNPILKSYWISNIGPAQNSDGIASDMATWYTPGFGKISPFSASDGEGKYPNFGNWGLTYIISGTCSNTGTRSRTIAFSLQAPAGGGAPIAYRLPGGTWSNTKMNAGTSFDYYTLSVPAGQTVAFDARYILGGPGAGSLLNRISLKN